MVIRTAKKTFQESATYKTEKLRSLLNEAKFLGANWNILRKDRKATLTSLSNGETLVGRMTTSGETYILLSPGIVEQYIGAAKPITSEMNSTAFSKGPVTELERLRKDQIEILKIVRGQSAVAFLIKENVVKRFLNAQDKNQKSEEDNTHINLMKKFAENAAERGQKVVMTLDKDGTFRVEIN